MTTIITAQALQGLPDAELRRLHHQAHQQLAASRPGSTERRRALANLETIARQLATCCPAPGPR